MRLELPPDRSTRLPLISASLAVLTIVTGTLALFRVPRTLTNLKTRLCAWFGAAVGGAASVMNAIAYAAHFFGL